MTLDSGLLDIEIVDISAENDEFPSEQLQWADACLIVYSITDRSSYEYASRSLGEMRQLQNTPVAYLVGNKADLDHLRKVSNFFLVNLSCLRNYLVYRYILYTFDINISWPILRM